MVAEVTYLTWTEDNLLRRVSYQGQREDKPARQCPARSAYAAALWLGNDNRNAARLGARAAPLLLTRQSPSLGESRSTHATVSHGKSCRVVVTGL